MLGRRNAGTAMAPAPALIGHDEFQLAIPWRDALQQGPPPLHQPGPVCSKLDSLVEHFAANGTQSLNCLSHPTGQAQTSTMYIREVCTRSPWSSRVGEGHRCWAFPCGKRLSPTRSCSSPSSSLYHNVIPQIGSWPPPPNWLRVPADILAQVSGRWKNWPAKLSRCRSRLPRSEEPSLKIAGSPVAWYCHSVRMESP